MSNLPPGVSEHMIPGNRPEDVEWEDFIARLSEKLPKQYSYIWDRLDEDYGLESAVLEMLDIARNLGIERGYSDCKADQEIDRMLADEEAYHQPGQQLSEDDEVME